MRNLKFFLLSLSLSFCFQHLYAQGSQSPEQDYQGSTEARETNSNLPYFTGSEAICPFNSATYTIQNLNTYINYTFNWEVSGGYIVAGPNLPQFSNSVTVFWNSTNYNGSISVDVILPWGNTHYSFHKNVSLTPSLPYYVTPDEICTGQMVIGNASIPGGSNYQWSFAPVNGSPANGLNIFSPTGPTATIEGIFPGRYNITVNASYCGGSISYGNQIIVSTTGCDSGGMYFTANPENLNPETAIEDIQIYPNPVAKGQRLTIVPKVDSEQTKVQLVTSSGQVIRQWQTINDQNEFSTSDLPTGVYLLQVQDEYSSFTKRIVVTN